MRLLTDSGPVLLGTFPTPISINKTSCLQWPRLLPMCWALGWGWGHKLGLPRDWEPFVSSKRGRETVGSIVVLYHHPSISLTKLWDLATDATVDKDAKLEDKTSWSRAPKGRF